MVGFEVGVSVASCRAGKGWFRSFSLADASVSSEKVGVRIPCGAGVATRRFYNVDVAKLGLRFYETQRLSEKYK